MRTKKNIIVMLCVLILAFLFCLDTDVFSHGYFTDAIEYDRIYEKDIQGYLDLSKGEYTLSFTPQKKHFTGFVLYLANQLAGDSGTLQLKIFNRSGEQIDKINVDLSKAQDRVDYKVYTNRELKKGQEYSVKISAKDCSRIPKMILIDKDYISAESKDSNLLIGYAYKESTFNTTEKVLITLFMLGLLLVLFSAVNNHYKNAYAIRMCGGFVILVSIMAWNFSFNTFCYRNSGFADFDKYSEGYVTSTIKAEKEGFDKFFWTNLNGYTDVTGLWIWSDKDKTFLTDDCWTKGYNNTQSQILLRTSDYVKDMAVVGNSILFENGDQFPISNVSAYSVWTTVTLNSGRILNWWKHGDLSKIKFIDANGNNLPRSYCFYYQSQYGLHGKIFRCLARYFEIDFLRVLIVLAAATTFLLIAWLIGKKYNYLYAGVFYITFLLAPWVVNFSNNLYWVEFTWFLPVAAGLFCAWKINDENCRAISFLVTYLFVLIKSLCGYEYITVIMLSVISFSVVDFIAAAVQNNKKQSRLILKTIFALGIVSLLGFFTAMCIHATCKLESEGSVLKGLKLIFENDVIRRTIGGNVNNFYSIQGREGYAQLASVWETIVQYFHFPTEIITGIDGSLFPIICIVPILIFLHDANKNKLNIKLVAMYCVNFIASMSWFVLAKSHSYVHTHLNYVLWYFGFVQTCLYVVVEKIRTLYFELKENKR